MDGHVDRWDRDEQLKYESDTSDKKARDDDAGISYVAAPTIGPADAGAKGAGAKKTGKTPKPAGSATPKK